MQVLSSLLYEVVEFEDVIFASKYCEAEKGGLVCLMVECCAPFDRFSEWEGLKSSDGKSGEVDRLLSELNGYLAELVRVSGPV